MASPLSDKVALFNMQAKRNIENQALNPFSQDKSAKALDRPKFSKEEYGRPAKGSLSEKRGVKATIHVCKEMLELCQIIDEYGAQFNEDGTQKIIYFGELFNIYTVISDKLVGMLLRARKHKLVDFEGEVLFQRRDDNVPIVLLKPIKEIREMFNKKIEEARALGES
ncbi:actin-binding Rho-activating protein isoform X2 [Chrysoperla carnea]|nr:actin-binding Rho-activating protein isoform X2 [Chrysoperla carnea]